MALVQVPQFKLIRDNSGWWVGTETARNIAASTHWVGVSFIASKTGTITAVHFKTLTVTSPLFTLEAGVVNLNASGFPLGTDVSVGDAVTNPAASTNYSATVSASVTRGTEYGLIVRVKSGTYTSGSANIAAFCGPDFGNIASYGINYLGACNNTGASAFSASLGFVSCKYSDGWYGHPLMLPNRAVGTVSTGTTSGNVVGNKFTTNARVRVIGYCVHGELDGSANVEMYSGSDNTAISNSSATITAGYRAASDVETGHYFFLATPVTLDPGTYRVGVRLTSTTENALYQCQSMVDSTTSEMLVMSGLTTNWQKSTYASGAWTDTNTTLLSIIPICDQVDDGRPWAQSQVGF
jgi:hypothetical protein